MPRHAFLTVTDSAFFPGTLATVNSILEFHPEAPMIVVDTGAPALTHGQAGMLRRVQQVRVLRASCFARSGRKLGAYELKAYACHDLCRPYEVLILIDSDCLLSASVEDQIRRCWRLGGFLGGRDGEGKEYDESYRIYGIDTPCRNPDYMSTSLMFCAINRRNREILKAWVDCCSAAQFNATGPYPGHGDQGILNALIFARRPAARVTLLENALWSQHWTYWTSAIAFQDGSFVNRSAGNRKQRAFHCGGGEKWWTYEHGARVMERNPGQSCAYAWFLAMLWFGRCRDWVIDPADYLPPASQHLWVDLVQFLPQIMQLLPRSRSLWDGLTDVMAQRILDTVPPGRDARTEELAAWAKLLRARPHVRRVVHVAAHPFDTTALALRFLNRDIDFHAVGCFGAETSRHPRDTPSFSPRKILQILARLPSLRVRFIPGDPVPAGELFDDASIDLLILDRGVDWAKATSGIEVWLPKVARGGLVAGTTRLRKHAREILRQRIPCLHPGASGALWWGGVDFVTAPVPRPRRDVAPDPNGARRSPAPDRDARNRLPRADTPLSLPLASGRADPAGTLRRTSTVDVHRST